MQQSWSPVLYSVHREQRDQLAAMGWYSLEVGSEMVVDPRQWKTTGKKWQDIRTAINKAKRSGISDVMSTFNEAPNDIREQIEEISEQWAQLKALPEMKFTLGGVEELRDPRVRLLYAIDAERARAGRHQLAAHLARRAHRRLDAGLHAPSHRQSQRHYGVPDRAHGRAPA